MFYVWIFIALCNPDITNLSCSRSFSLLKFEHGQFSTAEVFLTLFYFIIFFTNINIVVSWPVTQAITFTKKRFEMSGSPVSRLTSCFSQVGRTELTKGLASVSCTKFWWRGNQHRSRHAGCFSSRPPFGPILRVTEITLFKEILG